MTNENKKTSKSCHFGRGRLLYVHQIHCLRQYFKISKENITNRKQVRT